LSPIIQFSHVSKNYQLGSGRPRSFQEVIVQRRLHGEQQTFWALHDASFAVEAGERVALIGANGSGKSTILKLMSRVIEPSSGRIVMQGRVAGLLELGTGFHPDLTGRENVFLNGSILGISRRDIQRQLEAIVDFADIGPFIDVQVRNYSSGMVVRLGFAITTILQPDILLIDEVLAVGDQNFQRKCIDRLGELREAGVTLVFVSHNLEQVRRLCQRAILIDQGVVQADGDSEEVAGLYLAAQAAVGGLRRAPQFGVASHQRWGSFQAEITRVEMLDREGSCPLYFQTGDFFRLRLHYVAHQRIEQPTFGMAFYRRDGVHVNGPNSVRAECAIPYIEDEGFVDYVIEQLPLNQAEYEISVAIYDHDSTVSYDHQHRLHLLEVRAPGLWVEEGVVHVPGVWRHTPQAPASNSAVREQVV
jgi:ABC-type polysaccharide/polyol phosphate transport system ATPase subunit